MRMRSIMAVALMAGAGALGNDVSAQEGRGSSPYWQSSSSQRGERGWQDRSDRSRTSSRRGDDESSLAWAQSLAEFCPDDDESSRGSDGISAEQFIRQYDRNDDQVLSRNELPEKFHAALEQLDRNRDDRLTAGELRLHGARMLMQRRPTEMILAIVLDGQQDRSSPQMVQKVYEKLQRIDRNEDGRISQSELSQHAQRMASQVVETTFERLDENEDDQLARDEVQESRLARKFDRIDRNQDGRVSRNELRQAIQQIGQPMSDDRSGGYAWERSQDRGWSSRDFQDRDSQDRSSFDRDERDGDYSPREAMRRSIRDRIQQGFRSDSEELR